MNDAGVPIPPEFVTAEQVEATLALLRELIDADQVGAPAWAS